MITFLNKFIWVKECSSYFFSILKRFYPLSLIRFKMLLYWTMLCRIGINTMHDLPDQFRHTSLQPWQLVLMMLYGGMWMWEHEVMLLNGSKFSYIVTDRVLGWDNLSTLQKGSPPASRTSLPIRQASLIPAISSAVYTCFSCLKQTIQCQFLPQIKLLDCYTLLCYIMGRRRFSNDRTA